MKQIVFNEERHEYTVDGIIVPSVTDILYPLKAREHRAINPAVLEKARLRGEAVHESLEELDLAGEVEVVPETQPFIQAYLDFVNVYRPEWELIENRVYSEQGYAGTVDRAGYIAGKYTVLDIKTMQSPTAKDYLSVCAQTAAYTMAIKGEEDRTVKRYALFLKSDGNYRLFDCEEWEEKHYFDPFGLFNTLLQLHKQINRITGRP